MERSIYHLKSCHNDSISQQEKSWWRLTTQWQWAGDLAWLAALSAVWFARGWYKSSHKLSVQRSNSSTSPRTHPAFTQWMYYS